MTLNISWFTRVRDDAVVEVVGEWYRQANVAQARPPGPDDLPPGLPPPPPGFYKAMLTPEPTNQYDPNAVAVYLWAGGAWAIAGYLSRQQAPGYQPLFTYIRGSKADASPSAIACDAARVRERDGMGVTLHLGTPGECIAELVTDHRTPGAHPWAGKPIAFTGYAATTTIHGIPVDRNAEIMLARWAGCDVLPRLTKKTSALIVVDPDEVSGNLQRAKDYGVQIVQEPEFLAAIGIPADAIGRVTGRWAQGYQRV